LGWINQNEGVKMDKVRNAFFVIFNSLHNIVVFWPRVLVSAFLKSIFYWILIGFADFIFIFFAYLFAIIRRDNVQFKDFFPPYYLPAAIVVLVIFFCI
jgi:hypothetical protein